VSPVHKVPTFAVWATGLVSLALLLSALASELAFSYIIGMAALGFFAVYVLTTAGLLIAHAQKRIPPALAGAFDLGRYRFAVYVLGVIVFGAVAAALLILPDFRPNAIVFAVTMALAALWWLAALRKRVDRAEAGPRYALASSNTVTAVRSEP
jgi:amino acid transporter